MKKYKDSYFTHDRNASHSPKLSKVILNLGVEGYGLFFILLEELSKEDEHKIVLDDDFFKKIKKYFDIRKEKVLNLINNFNLFTIEKISDGKNLFYSEGFIERLQAQFERTEKYRKAGISSGEARRRKKEEETPPETPKDVQTTFEQRSKDVQTTFEQETNNQSKLNQSKLNESKSIQSGNNEMTQIDDFFVSKYGIEKFNLIKKKFDDEKIFDKEFINRFFNWISKQDKVTDFEKLQSKFIDNYKKAMKDVEVEMNEYVSISKEERDFWKSRYDSIPNIEKKPFDVSNIGEAINQLADSKRSF